jgi:hypothetical protein
MWFESRCACPLSPLDCCIICFEPLPDATSAGFTCGTELWRRRCLLKDSGAILEEIIEVKEAVVPPEDSHLFSVALGVTEAMAVAVVDVDEFDEELTVGVAIACMQTCSELGLATKLLTTYSEELTVVQPLESTTELLPLSLFSRRN